MSSIETLLEAAKYVDEDQPTVANKVMPLNKINTMAKSQESIKSSNSTGVITHWRKRAVAQSVMESQTRDLLEKNSASSVKEEVTSTGPIYSSVPHSRTSLECTPLLNSGPQGNGLYTISGPPIPSVHPSTQDHVDKSIPTESSTISSGNSTINVTTCETTNQKMTNNAQVNEIINSKDQEMESVAMQDLATEVDLLRKNVQFQNFPKADRQKPSQSGAVTREAHNLLEKNRRAHLKECFDNLRNVVPSLGTRKVSNLIVLQEAFKYVQSLKRKEQKQQHEVEALVRQKIDKQGRLAKLRRKLSLKLEPSAIDEILKVDESSDDMINKLASPVKSGLPGYGSSAVSAICRTPATNYSRSSENTKGDPGMRGPPIVKNPNSSESTRGEIAQFAKSSLSELIDKDPPQRVAVTNSIPDAFSHKSTVPSLQHAAMPFANLMHLPHLDPKKGLTGHVFGTLPTMNLCKPDENLNTIRQISCAELATSQVPNAGCQDNRVAGSEQSAGTTYKLSQISANYGSSKVCALNDQTTISATVHRVQSTKPHKTRIVTSEISSFLDSGNGGNPLKIVVKPVDSAKQHALGSKTVNQKGPPKSSNFAETSKQTNKAGSSRPRQTVFRPRSSMTPPPPSKITPYFPRFSVGSGGSPPLTTIVPDISDVTLETALEDQRPDPLMSQTQILWKHPHASDPYKESPKTLNSVTFKRKLPNDLELSGAKVARQSVPKISSGTAERRMQTAATTVPPTLPANSDTESETETTSGRTASQKLQEKSTRSFISAFLSSTPPIPPTREAKGKSVTQVCYSTDMKAVQPTIPSTLTLKSYSETKTQDSQPDLATPRLLNANLQFVPGAQQQMPQFAYQIVHPATFMNPTLVPAPVPGRYVNVKVPETNKNRGKVDTGQEDPGGDAGLRTEANVNPVGPPQVVSTMPQIQSIPANQVPQIQYVLPMGFGGMMGGGGQHMAAFPSAMGGFMQLAPIPQGQGWSYVVPQGMVVEDNSKSLNPSAVNGRKTDTPSQNGQDSGNVTTADVPNNPQTVLLPGQNTSISPSTPNEAAPGASPIKKTSVEQVSLSTPQATVSAVPVQTLHIASNPPVAKWHQQAVQRAVQQPQFQIVRPNFQTANPVMIPVGAAGGSYIIGGPQTGLSAAQGVTAIPRCQANIGYSFPIMGYQPMQINASQMQIAALPNGSFNIPRGMTYGIAGGVPAQVMALNNNKQNGPQGTQGTPHPSSSV